MMRLFRNEDAKECSKIMLDCIDHNLISLNKENKEFMIKMSMPDKLIEKSKKVLFYVYEEKGKILGTGVLDNEEIRTMFVKPTHQKKKELEVKFLNF